MARHCLQVTRNGSRLRRIQHLARACSVRAHVALALNAVVKAQNLMREVKPRVSRRCGYVLLHLVHELTQLVVIDERLIVVFHVLLTVLSVD